MRNWSFVVAVAVFVVMVSAAELTFISGPVAALVLVAGSTTALFFSAVNAGGKLANGDDEASAVKWKGFGNELSLPARLLNNNMLVLAMFSVILFMQYKILDATEKLIAATAEYTYVLALPQEQRERLRIAMPDSLRRKLGGDRSQ